MPSGNGKGVAVCNFEGMLSEVQEYKGQKGTKYVHIFKLKAANEYDPPNTVVVTSVREMGKVGQVMPVQAEVKSYSRWVKGRQFFDSTLMEVI